MNVFEKRIKTDLGKMKIAILAALTLRDLRDVQKGVASSGSESLEVRQKAKKPAEYYKNFGERLDNLLAVIRRSKATVIAMLDREYRLFVVKCPYSEWKSKIQNLKGNIKRGNDLDRVNPKRQIEPRGDFSAEFPNFKAPDPKTEKVKKPDLKARAEAKRALAAAGKRKADEMGSSDQDTDGSDQTKRRRVDDASGDDAAAG